MSPIICDIIEDGFQISEIILTEKVARELELLDMKEDQELEMLHKATFYDWILEIRGRIKISKLIFDFWYKILLWIFVVCNDVRQIEILFTVDQSTSYIISTNNFNSFYAKFFKN